MTWSAGRTAMTALVERCPTTAAPRVTAAQVSRPTGSAMILPLGSLGNWRRTSGAWTALVMMKMFCHGTSGRTRSTAWRKNERPPRRVTNCLGVFSRLTGQNRSPRPPAMMMTKRSFWAVLAFMELFLDGLDERAGEARQVFGQAGGAAVPGNFVDNGAADHHGIGIFRHHAPLLGGGDAK